LILNANVIVVLWLNPEVYKSVFW